MLSRTRRIVAVAAPVATVAVVAALAFDAVERGRGAERLVAHTRDVMQNGDAVLARLVDAETGERGYVVTGGDEYLEPYERARADVDRSLGALRRLTADNPAQQRRLDTLDRIAHARFVRLDSVITARRERGFEASRQVMLTGRGKSLMDSARVLLKEMQETESRLLARRNSAARWRTRVTVAVVLAGLLVTLGVALTVNRLLLRAAAREEEGARQLAERNALLAEQAAELEQQVEETQALAEELEQANDELLAKTAEAEEARRASEEANRAKAEFLATMSHELRTPLNAIGGYAELMALGIHGPVNAAQLRDLDRIRRGQRHLLGIITDILNFSRIDAGQMQLAVRDVPLPPLVDEVWSMIEPQASAKGIRYECEAVHDGGPLVAHADPDR
ncbi:MAG: CHASE3 domain-containing protein, partial [Gemmatimonadaceae bacterium]